MEASSSNLVDLCLGDIVQDVTGDDVSAAEASAAWRTGDTEVYTAEQQAEQDSTLESTNAWQQQVLEAPVKFEQPPEGAALQEPEDAAAQEPDTVVAQEREDAAAQESEDAAAQDSEDAAAQESEDAAAQETVINAIDAKQPLIAEQEQLVEADTNSLPADTADQASMSATASDTSRQDQKDKTAATLSKELRKLQAETTVLQEHSRRLQEKAAVIQQQRAADQAREQGRSSNEYIKQPSLSERFIEDTQSSEYPQPDRELSQQNSRTDRPQATHQRQDSNGTGAERQPEFEAHRNGEAERQIEAESFYQRQSSNSGGTDREPAYEYTSDATMPSQDGALQWSIGGVPLQQQLRLLSADNGMEADDATSRQDSSQGLQWGPTTQTDSNTYKKKKSVTSSKQPKDSQAGKVNSIAALHDAHSKQLLNPLKMRKASQGAAANPVIRQRSVAQQAKHKQHFADTLRRNSEAEAAVLANEQSMQSAQSMPPGQSMHSMHSMSPDFQQQQAHNGAGQFGAYHRVQLEPYAGALASSKSEPHGLYSKSAAQLYAAQLASSGLPKANSVHDLDMGIPKPAVAKRRSKAAARQNPGSAPGPYAQGWGQALAPSGFPAAMPGMPSSMYSQQGMPLLPQLGPSHMGMGYMGSSQMGQQPFGMQGPTQVPQGPNKAILRRVPGRQAGSALPLPDMGTANGPFGTYPMQQQQPGMMQSWGGPFAAAQQPFPLQYAQDLAMSSFQAGPNPFGGYPAAASGYPGMQSTSMLPRRAKNKGTAVGQPSMQQPYAAGLIGAPMQPAGYPSQPIGGMPQMGGVPSQMGGPSPWGNGTAMQQRADAMQQYQLQHYQQMQSNVMQHLQQNQNHALLKYGNFDHAAYAQSDLKSRPEFRTY